MAVDIKVAPDEKLELVQTLITDTNPNSDYFNVSELPDTFSGGKNAFLIAGSDKLLSNTEIKIQIRDAAGNICYVEYSNGAIPIYDPKNPSTILSYGDYYEGNSKVVAVYVYPNLTAFGPATITILGQTKDVPQEWNGLYSVKWEKQININPALANTTRVRFYKRPAVQIVELLQPLYSIVSGSKVASLVTQSFANITVNQLDTFAGDVARVKVYRTSAGDISDYELIQDISIESKNLLTTYALSASVVGNAGLFGPDSLTKVWNTSSLHAVLDSTHIADGLQLTGSGKFKYTSSLSLLSSNTYELELDVFYTGSTQTNLVAYVSGTQNGAYPITTFSGSIPTKNFGTTTIPFKIINDEPTASLYLSQSSGTNQWHVGNISLNLSQDTAFSPNEISFITSMPTILGNDTFNFKFELYDINNNYVPVAVTQSATFTGGNNNIGGTLILISGSTSASNAALAELSRSVSGTISYTSQSVSSSISSTSSSLQSSSLYISSSVSTSLSTTSASLQSSSLYISASISGTIVNVSASISTSLSNVSASLSSSIGGISATVLSSSFGQLQTLANGHFSGSFISDTIIYSPNVGGINGYFSELFKVGTSPSIYLDARQNPRKIFIGGVSDSGSYNNANTSVYMDSNGKFSLKDQLSWDGSTLTVNGVINVTGGNAATSASAYTMATNSANSAISTASGSAYTMATNSANSAYNSAVSTAGSDATSKANAAKDAAISAASIDATNKSNTAFDNAAAQVKSLADGGYTGAFISSTTIYAPVIGGTIGYFSKQFRVGAAPSIVLDGENKRIYIGGGAYNNSNTGFYVDSSGNFSLGDKLSFNGSTLAVNGAITATYLTATQGGNIAGWITDSTNFSKSNGTYTTKFSSTDSSIKMTLNSTGANKVAIYPTEIITPISIPSTADTYFNYNGGSGHQLADYTTFTSDGGMISGIDYVTDSGRGDYDGVMLYNTGTGIITLINSNEEIWIENTLNTNQFTNCLSAYGLGYGDSGNADVSFYLLVKKFANWSDANNNINHLDSWTRFLGSCSGETSGGGTLFVTYGYVNPDPISIMVNSNNNYFRIIMQVSGYWNLRNYEQNDGFQPHILVNKPNVTIDVRFGAVLGGQTIISPVGIQSYATLKNYMIAAQPSVTGQPFFDVKGAARFQSGLTVTGSFSATTKAFKIEHPLDENKWLYHSSIEGPAADLIYRGIAQLENGSASVDIDTTARMTDGTFEALTRRPQLFLQNNQTFDRVKGYVESGSVFIICENASSKALIDWTIIAERKDDAVLSSEQYNEDGNYTPEKIKRSYVMEKEKKMIELYSSSSI
jgi:hypothetical protein